MRKYFLFVVLKLFFYCLQEVVELFNLIAAELDSHDQPTITGLEIILAVIKYLIREVCEKLKSKISLILVAFGQDVREL